MTLPGDAEAFLAYKIARAVRRDGQLNYHERRARAIAASCYQIRGRYESWPCSWDDPCPYCEEVNDT